MEEETGARCEYAVGEEFVIWDDRGYWMVVRVIDNETTEPTAAVAEKTDWQGFGKDFSIASLAVLSGVLIGIALF